MAPTASNAPIPSSQARDGREKNAHGALAVVSQSESAKDATTTTIARMPMRLTRRMRSCAPSVTTSRSAGQKR